MLAEMVHNETINWMVELEKYNDTEQSAKRHQLAIKHGAES